jgi:hypothetical protein
MRWVSEGRAPRWAFWTAIFPITSCTTEGQVLHSIDPWRAFDDAGYIDIHHFDNDRFEATYRGAARKLAKFGSRSRILREASPQDALSFSDGQLDFVFSDAQHQYEAVCADLNAWYPKIRAGGVLAGHD